MMNRLWVAALALTCWIVGPAHAAAWDDSANSYLRQLATTTMNGVPPRGLNPDPHFLTISPPDWYDAEQAAVSGFSWGTHPARVAVGGAFRGYSDGSPWAFGISTEAISSPTSTAHVIGQEIDVISRNPNSAGAAKWGLNIILMNRTTGPAGNVESGLGANRYNENSRAVVIESFARSTTGEYAGWQTGIHFGKTAFDRTVSKPYASAIDVSEVEALVAWYVLVWRCGELKCGLKVNGNNLEVWRNIDMLPQLWRVL